MFAMKHCHHGFNLLIIFDGKENDNDVTYIIVRRHLNYRSVRCPQLSVRCDHCEGFNCPPDTLRMCVMPK